MERLDESIQNHLANINSCHNWVGQRNGIPFGRNNLKKYQKIIWDKNAADIDTDMFGKTNSNCLDSCIWYLVTPTNGQFTLYLYYASLFLIVLS